MLAFLSLLRSAKMQAITEGNEIFVWRVCVRLGTRVAKFFQQPPTFLNPPPHPGHPRGPLHRVTKKISGGVEED